VKRSIVGIAACMLSALPFLSWGQSWPTRPVTLVVPFSAGGPIDVVARHVSRSLGEQLGQPVVVENKAGAGGTIAANFVARAQPDGYTLLVVVPGLTGSESLYPQRRYDLTKDFAPVSLIGTSPNWLLTPKDGPFKSIDDVVKLAGAHPGRYAYGQGGTGGLSHLTAELMKTRRGLDIVNVGYRGNAPALTDLLAGQVQLLFDQPSSSESFVKSGQLRPLAVTSAARMPNYPNVPTMQEAGFSDFVIEVWYGLAFPKGTSPAIVQSMHAALEKALANQELRGPLQNGGLTIKTNSPEAFAAQIRNDVSRWRTVIEKNRITTQ
jgi:tripartite-type tricarboxylate transporter receptor subunit TctC